MTALFDISQARTPNAVARVAGYPVAAEAVPQAGVLPEPESVFAFHDAMRAVEASVYDRD